MATDSRKTKKELLEELSRLRKIHAESEQREENLLRALSQREAAIEALTAEYRFSKTLFHTSPALLVVIGADGKTRYMNDTLLAMLEYSEKEVLGKDYLATFVPEEDQDSTSLIFQSLLEKNEPFLNENHVVSKSGITYLVEWHGRPVFTITGELEYFFAIGIDITKRKQAEVQLKESEAKYKALVEQSAAMFYLHDMEGRIHEVNRAALSQSGYSREELLRMEVFDLYADRSDSDNTLRQWKQTQPEKMPLTSESQYYRKDGASFPVEIYSGKVFFDDEARIVSLVHDITHRKNMEAELLKARKLESVGTLAGGIAHDFNNLLTIIQGHLHLAQGSSPGSHRYIDNLNAAMDASERAADLTQRLITFSGGGSPQREPRDIGKLLRETVQKDILAGSIETTFIIADDLRPVNIDERQIRQVIRNLLTNALESMPRGGTLTVRAEPFLSTLDDSIPIAKGAYIRISFEDTGAGISSENLPYIFDPYFSTKQRGSEKGMGLGLSVCHSIINRHNGYITVKSVPEGGAVFYIYLPLDRSGEEAEKDSPRQERYLSPRRILIMDDEAEIRYLTGIICESLGCSVDTASEGQIAIDLYTRALSSDHPFDLVILDLTVKEGFGGLETMKQLQTIDPQVKAILFSGYIKDPAIINYKKYGFRGALKKPFKKEDLQALLDLNL